MFTDKNGDRRYKLALHTHTKNSDGHLSPSEVAKVYRRAGYDAIAFTDHWFYHGEEELDGLTVLSGIEYNLGNVSTETKVGTMHIVGIGMNNDPVCMPSMSRQEVVDRINAMGGLAVLAHPCWSLNRPEDALNLHGLAATEIYNTVSDVHESFRPYSGYFVDLAANEGCRLPLLATDDSHYYDGTDEAKSYVMVRAENSSASALLAALKQGDFYSSQGPELLVRKENNRVTVYCSPVDKIVFVSNLAWGAGRVVRGENLTYAEYRVPEGVKWLRVEVNRGDRFAWSNFIQ